MNEFLINYRNNSTGALVNVHVVNVNALEQATSVAENIIIEDEEYNYDSAYQLIDRSPHSTGIPF